MTREEAVQTARCLRKRGFDGFRFRKSEGTLRVTCSQCQVLVICGTATHETGCPNQRKKSFRR